MIFLPLKTFKKDQNFDCRRRRLTLVPKKLFKFGFKIENQEVFFCRGLWEKFVKKSGS